MHPEIKDFFCSLDNLPSDYIHLNISLLRNPICNFGDRLGMHFCLLREEWENWIWK